MSFRFFAVKLTVLVIALTSFSPGSVNAQSEERPMTIQFSRNFDRFMFIDEIGIQMSMAKLYESYLDIETYRLDSGDLLGISLEGNISGIFRGLRVNSQGLVLLPQAGLVPVRGLLFQDAAELIAERLAKEFPDTRVTLFIDQPRAVRIHVAGNVPFAGPHLVLAQTRLDQAIYFSFFQPRPDQNGDDTESETVADPLSPITMLANKYPDDFVVANQYALRNITITRADGTLETGDLIRYLLTGDQEANPVVKEGDIIHINRFHVFNPRISISGAVHRPLELEFRDDDTVEQLVRMAGGTTFDAHENYLRVIRRTDQGLRELVLDDSIAIAGYEIQPNDRLIIPVDRDRRGTQSIVVFGEAHYTGRFPIVDGITTLYDIMQLTGGLTDQAMPHAAYMLRTRPGRTEFGTREAFNPLSLRRVSDQFEQGFEYLTLEAELIMNRVHVDLRDTEQLKSIKLFDGDQVFIPKDDGTIFVFGQVNQPGYYNFDDGKSARDYIRQAGGMALSADPDRIFVVKSQTSAWFSPDEATIEPGDLVFVDRVPFDELQSARAYDLQKRAQRNSNIQLIMTGLTTITSIITAYIAVTR
jgi:polysaccharide biosynthesis/export protein